jgi:predicted O-methyltransferase YrrM
MPELSSPEIGPIQINAAATFEPGSSGWLHPVQLGTTTLLQLSARRSTIAGLVEVLRALAPDEYIAFMQRYYEQGIARFGDAWGYTDQLAILHAAATLLQPEHYLEIGVFRGRSMAVVASAAPECAVYGFDMWIENYSDLQNPGPAFVRSQLQRIGHRGDVTLISGDSQATVPAFLQEHPDLFFDLITVDGDHSEAGARLDLEHVLPRLKIGGVLVFDDIAHPQFPWLERAWDEVIGANTNFASAKYAEVGHGVAFAIRRDAGARVDGVRGTADTRLGRLSAQLKEARVEGRQLQAMLEVKEQYEQSLRDALASKDEYAETLREALASKDEYLAALKESLASLEAYAESLRETLAAREAENTDAAGQIGWLREALAAREAEIAAAQAQIAALHEALAEADGATRQAGTLQELVAAREAEIASANNHIQALQAAVAAREAEAAGTEAYVGSLREALAARESELANAKIYLESLEQHLERAESYARSLEPMRQGADPLDGG